MHHMIQCHVPDWSTSFCTDPAAACATRRAFLERYADTDVLVYPAHFPAPTGGRVEGSAQGYTFRYIGE
jgi:glyoxylase-like metal-dependent hydrolase (beta-lactamase superfamily II)